MIRIVQHGASGARVCRYPAELRHREKWMREGADPVGPGKRRARGRQQGVLVRRGTGSEPVTPGCESTFAARCFETLGCGHSSTYRCRHPPISGVRSLGDADDRYKALLAEDTNPDRLHFFSDAFFAIAMTLLVIEITVPVLAVPSNGQHGAAVVELFPYFLAHTISCGIIALDGAGHHRKFSVTRRFDGGVVWITMVLLLLIAFLPFPTSLLSNYPGRIVPVALYASVVSAISLVQFWLWSHTYRRVFFDERIDVGIHRLIRRNLLVVPVVFFASIPIAVIPGLTVIFGGTVAVFFWALTGPVSRVVARVDRSRGRSKATLKDAARSKRR